jgi:hypothetical protein
MHSVYTGKNYSLVSSSSPYDRVAHRARSPVQHLRKERDNTEHLRAHVEVQRYSLSLNQFTWGSVVSFNHSGYTLRHVYWVDVYCR